MIDLGLGLGVVIALTFPVAALGGYSESGTGVVILSAFAGWAVFVLYETLTVGICGRTIGKRLLGVRVVRATDGTELGLARAFVRGIIPMLLLFTCYLYVVPFVWAAVASSRRGLHDLAAGSDVVRG
jgi:uncharacterized RDD family membrane protein YckC